MRRMATVSVASILLASFTPSAAAAVHRCFGKQATIVGTNGKDKLNGTGGPDVIVGLGGDDVVHGGGGNDRICLGENPDASFGERGFGDRGSDFISGGPGRERLYGGKGSDVLHLEAGGAWAIGGPAGDAVVGGSGRDFLGGEDGPGSGGSSAGGGYNYEFIEGEPGDDTFSGGGGNDRFYLGPGDKTIVGGKGIDRLVYWGHERLDFRADLETGRVRGPGRSRLRGVDDVHAWTLGDIVLRGDDGPNELLGAPSLKQGNAQLYGGGGDDLLAGQDDWTRRQEGDADLYGGRGDDAIVGQCVSNDEQLDELFGGPGADLIQPQCGMRSVMGGPGNDTLAAVELPQESSVTYDGGPGLDMITWPYSNGVSADLGADEAVVAYGEKSWTYAIPGIEAVQGSEYDRDVLLGDDGPNKLYGGTWGTLFVGQVADGDHIEGRGGDDELYGDDGNDELDGGEGEDKIDGGTEVDTCRNGEDVSNCEAS